MKSRHFDKDGTPINFWTWAEKHSIPEYTRVAWDHLPNGGHLSTVWLGLNHAIGSGAPLIFETMEFPPGGDPEAGYLRRWSTLEEALEGHTRVLAHLSGSH